MNKLIKIGIIAGFAHGIADAPTLAADSNGHYSEFGVGDKSCGSFLNNFSQKNQAYFNIGHWITGYLTAYNNISADTYDIAGNTDIEGIMYWIKNYCEKNPTDEVSSAASAYVLFAYPTRLKTAPKR